MRLSPRSLRDIALLCIGLSVIAAGAFYVSYSPRIKLQKLRLSGGSELGLRHALALELADECHDFKLDLKVVPSAGSEASLFAVQSGELDLALVQGGLRGMNLPKIRQVTALQVEPLHLLVTNELGAAIRSDGLAALDDRRINVGPDGSGTAALAQEFLDFLGLDAVPFDQAAVDARTNSTAGSQAEYRLMHVSYDEIMQSSNPGKLFDATFTISSLPSPIAKHLVETHAFELVPLPMSDAFSLDGKHLQGIATEISIDRRRVYETNIPAFTYSVSQAQPPARMQTIGTRLLLVANQSVPAETINRLLEVLYQSRLTKDSRPPIDITNIEGAAEFPRHPGAELFIQHHKPLIAGEMIGVLDNSLAIIATLLGGAFFLTQWYWQSRQRRREREFQGYLDAVMDIEQSLLVFDLEAQMAVGDLLDLRKRLSELKADAVHRFSCGEIEGEGLMMGFMTLANDARNHITRLLLHERDNVEECAQREQRSTQELWQERIRKTTPVNHIAADQPLAVDTTESPL